jgi:hypothetical protein
MPLSHLERTRLRTLDLVFIEPDKRVRDEVPVQQFHMHLGWKLGSRDPIPVVIFAYGTPKLVFKSRTYVIVPFLPVPVLGYMASRSQYHFATTRGKSEIGGIRKCLHPLSEAKEHLHAVLDNQH